MVASPNKSYSPNLYCINVLVYVFSMMPFISQISSKDMTETNKKYKMTKSQLTWHLKRQIKLVGADRINNMT